MPVKQSAKNKKLPYCCTGRLISVHFFPRKQTMTWFPERRQPTWLQRLCEAILKSGPVPQHVAIIMDGNRRFAVKNSIEKCEGHVRGFDKLAEVSC